MTEPKPADATPKPLSNPMPSDSDGLLDLVEYREELYVERLDNR